MAASASAPSTTRGPGRLNQAEASTAQTAPRVAAGSARQAGWSQSRRAWAATASNEKPQVRTMTMSGSAARIPSQVQWKDGSRVPGGGPFGWAPGEFTDDTQMALVLARRLLADGGRLDQIALASNFATWAAHPGTADVGSQTRNVLSGVRLGRSWEDAAGELAPEAAGNGSLMRVAPVALVASSPTVAMQLARAQSEVTHPNRWCTDACAVFAASLSNAISGASLDLGIAAGRAEQPEVREAVIAASARTRPVMSGFVLHTLTGALWAVDRADSFADAVWRAVSLGHDADTVGAVAGALAGAVFGETGIEPLPREGLTTKHPLFEGVDVDELRSLADRLTALADASGRTGG